MALSTINIVYAMAHILGGCTYYSCSIVDCVIIKKFFGGNCDISNLTRIKAIKLLDTIHIKWYVFIHFTKSLNILPTFAINVSSNTRTS